MTNHLNKITINKIKPKISVITVVFNGQKYIESTIISVLDQNYSELEYIIIDGGSDDRTIDIIKKYESKISYWLSENDNGIYDAMNKGIDKASGEWLIFMNCGDYFYDNNVLFDVFIKDINSEISVIHGGTFVRSTWGNFFIKSQKENEIWKSFIHQSLFVRSVVAKNIKFNTQFISASDFNFVYELFTKKYQFQIIDNIISSILYSQDGFTAKNQILSKKEVLKAIKNNAKGKLYFYRHYFYHYIAYVRKLIAINIQKMNPRLIMLIREYRDIKRTIK